MTVYIRVIKRWWGLLVLLTALGAAAGMALSQIQLRMYEAETTLLVTASLPNRDIAERLIPDQRSSLVKTYRELLLKRPVLEIVISELGLQTTPEKLTERLSIREVRDTQIIVLSALDPNPQQAANIANLTIDVFNRQSSTLLANPYAAGRSGLSVVEAAAVPVNPAGSGPLRTIVIAALMGLLLAGGIIFTLEYGDTRVRSGVAVAQLTSLPTVIEIGLLKGRRPHERLVTLTAPSSRAAEVYRMLRLVLETGPGERPIRTLIVTSAGAGEGKSLTAANLAVALAQTGLRTILIDANLRRPAIHELFQQPNTRGLTAALHPEALGSAYEHTIASGIEHLRLLLSGPLPSPAQLTPARLLTAPYLLALVEQLKEHTDVLIFDSPPVLEVIEAALLARSCDAALLVVKAGGTRAEDLLRACETLARTHVNLLGTVLNQAGRAAVGLLDGPAPNQWPTPIEEQPSRPVLSTGPASEVPSLPPK